MKATFRTLALLAAFSLGLISSARPVGDFTINFAAGILTASNSTPLANGSLVVLLTNGLNGSFSAPSSTAFVTGDDVLLGSFGTNSVDFDTAGGLIATLHPTFSGALTTGQQLMVRWFPSLTTASLAPGAGASYGEYSYLTGNLESDPSDWVLPGLGGIINPSLATASINGSSPNSAGQALLTIPEPSTCALLSGLAVLGLAGWRRHRYA